jgi:hypothetical protein
MGEHVCDLLPASHGLDPLQIEGLGNRLTGDGKLQGEAPGMQWRLRPRRALLRRARLAIMRVGNDSG